jgi:hypothetical protein
VSQPAIRPDGTVADRIERVPWERAEALVGRKLDRRRSYAWDGAVLFERYVYSTFCSGCVCDCGDGYPCSHDPNGCDECGHTGKRRYLDWWPHEDAQRMRARKRSP